MDRTATIFLQDRLREAGLRHGTSTGLRDEATHAACERALAARSADLPEDWETWSGKRKAVALLQLLCRDGGCDPFGIDGWWGPATDHAFACLAERLRTGRPPRPVVAPWPGTANPNGWPDEAGVAAVFGPPGAADGSARPPLVEVPCPWPLKLSWNMNQGRRGIRVHERVAPSLARVLARVADAYAAAEIEALGFNALSADYEVRPQRGGSRPSLHSWGVAIDFDHEGNPFPAGRDRARLAADACLPWWEIWEAEGWVSLGRTRNFEWGHVQAVRP